MKRIFSLLVMSLALVLSCQKEGPLTVNEITDLYTVPADAIELPALSGSESVWATDRRYFNLNFGSVLSTTLVGYDALLPTGQYLLGEDAIGNAVKAKTKLNGQAANDGFVTVNKNGNTYSISAVIDGTPLSWSGALPFKADPAAVQLTQVLSAQSNVSNGTNSVTMNLATDGISSELDQNYQTVWKGEGGYLALDLYSDDGYLHEGTYTPCAQGGVINPGEFGIGWDPGDLYGIGWVFTDWGTCWWKVSGGTAVAEKISSGVVTVTKTDDGWQIAWGAKYPQEYIFNGAIPALTKTSGGGGGGSTDFEYSFTEDELQPVTDQGGNLMSGVWKHPIHIYDKGGNEKAYLELLIAEGSTDYSGSYPSTSYASQPGQMADGWEFDGTAWGMGIMSGGSYYVNDAGEKVLMYAGMYTVDVKQLAPGAYQFSCSAFDYSAAGPDYVPGDNPGGGGDGDDDGSDLSGIVLIKTSGLTYTMEDVTASNTDSSQQPLSGMTLWRVTVLEGGSAVAAFDLGTSAGSSDIAGTYTVMSYPDAVGKAGNGWGFAAWNMFGGCYYIVDGCYYFIPADATITVSNNSDNTIKIKFSGSIQKDDYSDGGQGGLLLNNIAKS